MQKFLVLFFVIYFVILTICSWGKLIFETVILKLSSELKISRHVDLFIGTPRGIDITSVRRSFLKIPGVKDVHNLRLWSLSMDKIALSVHLAVGKSAYITSW